MTFALLVWLAIAATRMPPGPTDSRPADGARHAAETPLAALRRLDARVATVGFRLATAAADLCPQQEWQSGFTIQHISQYSSAGRADAAREFGLGDDPAVLAVAAGSPAAAAGLRADDAILSVDGVALPRAPAGAHDTFAPTASMVAALDSAFADGTARLDIRRAGRTLAIQVPAERGCASRFQLVPSESRNARADGRYVQITSGGAAFADTDDGLAAAVAHELSHNILRHRVRLNEAGVERGLLQHFGRSARLFRQTEIEADRYSMYLLDRAGYSLPAALAYWERYARAETNPIPTTHPAWNERLAAMRSEAAAIAQARAGGRIPRPPALDNPLR